MLREQCSLSVLGNIATDVKIANRDAKCCSTANISFDKALQQHLRPSKYFLIYPHQVSHVACFEPALLRLRWSAFLLTGSHASSPSPVPARSGFAISSDSILKASAPATFFKVFLCIFQILVGLCRFCIFPFD